MEDFSTGSEITEGRNNPAGASIMKVMLQLLKTSLEAQRMGGIS